MYQASRPALFSRVRPGSGARPDALRRRGRRADRGNERAGGTTTDAPSGARPPALLYNCLVDRVSDGSEQESTERGDSRAPWFRAVAVSDDLLGADGRRLVEELGELREGTAPEARIRVVERHLRQWVAEDAVVDPVADQVVRTLAKDATATVEGLGQALGLGERQLLRRCTVAFGYGPATLRRILRLQRFLDLAGDGRTGVRLADLAHEAGYADQQHLARDARAIARSTPTELVSNVRSVHAVDPDGTQ